MEDSASHSDFGRVRSIKGSSGRWQLVEDGWASDDEGGPVESLRRWAGDDDVEVTTVSSTGAVLEDFCRDVLGRLLLERAFSAGADKAELRRLARRGREVLVVADEDQLVIGGEVSLGFRASAEGLTARAASSGGAQHVVVCPSGMVEASRLTVRVG